MLIIPAIDLIGGKCVRLIQGDFDRETAYDLDPVDVARQFSDEGAEWLHVVDLDGAKGGSPENLEMLSRIAAASPAKIEFGGGLRSWEAIGRALGAGAARVVLGSVLLHDPELARRSFAELGDQIVAGIDCRNGKVATNGWLEDSDAEAAALAAEMASAGARRIILTDIARDGTLLGPNIGLLRDVAQAVRIPIVQSGGIGGPDDIRKLASLAEEAPEGVIVGKAIYEGRLSVREAILLARSQPSR